jgi:alkylated DNA nucleotide flippase Atl1
MTLTNAKRNLAIMKAVESGDGLTYSQIGRIHGVSRQVVSGVIYRNRTTTPDPIKAAARLITDHSQ